MIGCACGGVVESLIVLCSGGAGIWVWLSEKAALRKIQKKGSHEKILD